MLNRFSSMSFKMLPAITYPEMTKDINPYVSASESANVVMI